MSTVVPIIIPVNSGPVAPITQVEAIVVLVIIFTIVISILLGVIIFLYKKHKGTVHYLDDMFDYGVWGFLSGLCVVFSAGLLAFIHHLFITAFPS